MAAPSTMMRPLAPAKPSTTTTSNKSATTSIKTNNPPKARTLAPAPTKVAPSQASRPLKPLIAAKAQPNQQRILSAGSASTSSTTIKKLAPLLPVKSGKNETSNAQSYTSKQPAPIISTPTTSSLSLKEQAKQLEEEREKMAMQEDYESLNSDDEFSDHDESNSPSSSTTTNMNSVRDLESETTLHSNEKIQPKKEWVLPARAKPGRKPSEVEPPTKRKAQNRASQRAFRERRQSYLASLEAKVNEYEERGANVSTELQKVARKLKEENDELKKENSSLHAKLQQLEVALALRNNSRIPANSVKVEDVSMHSPHSTTARHENGMPVSMLLEDAPRRTSWDWSINSSRAGQGSSHTSPEGQTSSATEMQRDCGFCTEQSPCVCSGEAVLDFNAPSARKQQTHLQPSSLPLRSHLERRAITRQKLWYTVPASQHKAGRQVQICPTANMRRMNDIRALHNQPSPMIRNGSSMLPPPSLQPTRKATLWPIYPLMSPKKNAFSSSSQMQFTNSSSRQPQTPPYSPLSASSPTQQPTIFRMKKVLPGSKPAVCSGDPSDCAACATDPALAAFCRAVSSHLQSDGEGGGGNAVMLDAGNAIPLRKKRMRGVSITNMQRVSSNTPLQLTPQSLYTNGTTGSSSKIAMTPVTRPRLWSISRNSFHSDQNNANATKTTTQTALSSLRRHTTSDVRRETDNMAKNVAEGEVGIETIPEAWQRIKEHPSFANWQGGLDLLADVVTRKSSDEESNSSQSPIDKNIRHLGEEQTSSSKGDGDHQRSQVLSTEEDLGRKRRQMEFEQSSKEEHDGQQESLSQYNKRRKLYVDRRRVDDVLALMDRGTPSVTASPQSSQTRSNSSSATDEGQACACPLSKIM